MQYEVPNEDFVKPRYEGLVNSFHRDVRQNPKANTFVAKGSNMESLIEVWAETGGRDNQYLLLLSDILKNKLGSPIKIEKHPSTGDQKVIFDAEQNFYVTVMKGGDKLFLSGIGSVLGNYITEKVKIPSEEFVKAHWVNMVKTIHKEISEDPTAISLIEKNSNMDQLFEIWAGSSEDEGAPSNKSPFNIFADVLFSHVNSPIKCELHATTGNQKVIFDQAKGFYVTVVRIGDALFISGLGSALGNYITQEWEKLAASQ